MSERVLRSRARPAVIVSIIDNKEAIASTKGKRKQKGELVSSSAEGKTTKRHYTHAASDESSSSSVSSTSSSSSPSSLFPLIFSTRLVDGQECILSSCGRAITPKDDAVMVATDAKIVKNALKTRDTWQAKWSVGRVAFHRACWDTLSSRPSRLQMPDKQLVQLGMDNLEMFDDIDAIKEKAAIVARMIMPSSPSSSSSSSSSLLSSSLEPKRVVAFTGAGISTSSGIPDYRGTQGVDTLAGLGQATNKVNKDDDDDDGDVDYTKLVPTAAHRGLSEMMSRDLLHYVITQNCDDLHAKSGISPKAMSEMHGNVFVEYCEKCFHEYRRSYCVDLYSTDCYNEAWYVRCRTCGHNHYTGRKCSHKGCKGKLKDTIVNFGDDLHEKVLGGLDEAIKQARQADVIMCLGSSLTVTPASDLPTMAADLVICNLQETQHDKLAKVRLYAQCDIFMDMLLQHFRSSSSLSSSSPTSSSSSSSSSST
eukprot:TRINITY_DN6000_c0_g1_i3.p1 TRINITY_DN6000_c0_g1~~TRINITY_DN6000_c0_g1_i3.p1  ORF type:complete len:479 (+),score=107.49 TRINITY_DN6000_c0_g1_i3:8-1444(+)